MKIRTDFVTNSSSSSFIFGRPNKISGMTKESLLKNIQDFCKRVVKIREDIDKDLERAKPVYYQKLLECRKAYNSDEKNSFDIYYSLRTYLERTKVYDKIIQRHLRTLRDVIPNTDDIYLDFMYSDSVFNRIKEGLASLELEKHIYDFKEPNTKSNESLDELIFWYTDVEGYIVTPPEKWDLTPEEIAYITDDYDNELKEVEGNNSKTEGSTKKKELDYNSIVYRTIGELGIYGYESNDFPDIVVTYLQNLATVSCNHMG